MQFRLLGPLEILAGDEPIAIGAPKQRALLTLLLLHRDEFVPVDRIADALWSGSPPSSGTKAVQVYVAQVRKALGDAILVTEPGGYRLSLNGHQLDVDRFEALVDEGSRLLDAGEATAASRALREADALWRGPALSDLPEAADEARRLEELRLFAREHRIDAELALGRHEHVVGELQELVRRNPLRERLWELLMLALYRAGRQAEALAAYRDARRRLVDELGVEPGPELRALERAILEQDPAIAGPARARPASVDRPRRPRRPLVAGALVLVAAGVAVAALLLVSRDDHRQPVHAPVPGDSLAVVDARTGTLVDAVPAGRAPSAVAAGAGAVWALNADDRTVTRVDVETKARRTLGLGAAPTDVAFGLGGLWVGVAARVPAAGFAGHTATAVTRLDAETGFAEDPIALPRPRGVVSNGAADHLAFAAGSAWMINPDYSLSRIDPRTNEVVRVLKYLSGVAVASDGPELWVLNDDRTLARIDTAGKRVAQRVKVPAGALTTLAVGGGSVWALDPAAGRVWRVERSGQLSIDVGAGADAM